MPARPRPEEAANQKPKTTRPRIEFTDAQRAEIFVRDRATCCFSGANLWLLDAPLRPGYERDWVDHIVPATRGGKTTIDNGVCASHTFNGKKRNNGADSLYLFEEGCPTSTYYDIFGPLRTDQVDRLHRLENLVPSDWYLNRAIGQILLGFDYRCWRDRSGSRPSRDDEYWFKCAWKKIQQFNQVGDTSLEDRGIVTPTLPKSRRWLELREAATEESFIIQIEEIFPVYEANFKVWADYFYDGLENETPEEFLVGIVNSKMISKETEIAIRQDISIRASRG